MTVSAGENPTTLLLAFGQGSRAAADRLLPFVYDELRRLARRHLRRERPDHTLTPTALVHEAFLKLVDPSQVSWRDRQHFFALASSAMRQILIDHARRRQAARRGGGALHLSLLDHDAPVEQQATQLLALDDALRDLERYDADLARLVELRYFVGMSLPEAADVLDTSLRTAERRWTRARAFLLTHLRGEMPR